MLPTPHRQRGPGPRLRAWHGLTLRRGRLAPMRPLPSEHVRSCCRHSRVPGLPKFHLYGGGRRDGVRGVPFNCSSSAGAAAAAQCPCVLCVRPVLLCQGNQLLALSNLVQTCLPVFPLPRFAPSPPAPIPVLLLCSTRGSSAQTKLVPHPHTPLAAVRRARAFPLHDKYYVSAGLHMAANSVNYLRRPKRLCAHCRHHHCSGPEHHIDQQGQ